MKSSDTLPGEEHGPPTVTVHQMGRSIFDPIWAEREHANPNGELIHVLRGRVRIETPHYTLAGQPGDTLYTPANMPHRDVFPRGTVFEVYLVHVHWPHEARVLERHHPVQLAQAARGLRAMFADAFGKLYREFATPLAYHQPIVSLRATQILYELCRAAAMRGESPHPPADQLGRNRRRQIMHAARRLIDERLDAPISLEALADAIDVSPYYLSRVFSQESGFTLSSYLTQRRMEKARELLMQTQRPIKDIAYSVGYRDSHYFSRVFRGHFHTTPSRYRRQLTP